MFSINNLRNDIYYQKEYLQLYLKHNEQIFEFEFRENENLFYNIGIKRPILTVGSKLVDDGYFDLETVYGYGGVICNSEDIEFIKKASLLYLEKIQNEKIIAEFARIHPFNSNYHFFNDYFDFFVQDRKTILVNTDLETKERRELYSSTTRNILKNASKILTFTQSNDIDTFYDLYAQTMRKNHADDFYYFSKTYFEQLIKLKDTFLFFTKFNNIVISASFVMFSEKIGHYHLSANNDEYRKLNGNYFLLDNIFEFAKTKGIENFHLGGGRTNKIDDLLLDFKRKFSKNTKDFYIGGKVHNQTLYRDYNLLWKEQNPQDRSYFLKYRLTTT